MHSCKLFGTTGLAGGFLYNKKYGMTHVTPYNRSLAPPPKFSLLFRYDKHAKLPIS